MFYRNDKKSTLTWGEFFPISLLETYYLILKDSSNLLKKEKSLENFLKRLRKSCSGNFEKILNSNIQREILKNKI